MPSRILPATIAILSLFALAACTADASDDPAASVDVATAISPSTTTTEPTREVEESEENRDTTVVEVYPSACGTTELLYYADRKCGSTSKETRCLARPLQCSNAWSPVCGCDGKTYGNSCKAWKYGVDVASKGACP